MLMKHFRKSVVLGLREALIAKRSREGREPSAACVGVAKLWRATGPVQLPTRTGMPQAPFYALRSDMKEVKTAERQGPKSLAVGMRRSRWGATQTCARTERGGAGPGALIHTRLGRLQ